jgi:hypothetical protein
MTEVYLVFAGPAYYPTGGSDEYRAGFATEAEARAFVESSPTAGCDWAEIARLGLVELEMSTVGYYAVKRGAAGLMWVRET